MKRSIAGILVVALLLCLVGCNKSDNETSKQEVAAFYAKVAESQELLDRVSYTIYTYWYDAIYNNKYDGNITQAVMMAQFECGSALPNLEKLDTEIAELYKTAKNNSSTSALVKDVMSAYTEYYDFVVNVSGSFSAFSDQKENLKRELTRLLKELSYEI